MNLKKTVLLFFVCLVAVPIGRAQISSAQNQACNQEFARLLVEQQVADSKTVEETDKRVKILLRSADFLWKFDEPTARKYYAEAFQTAAERFKEKGYEEKKLGNGSITISSPDMRVEVIRAVAKKDGEWAKRLTEQVLQDFEKSVKDRKNDSGYSREMSGLLHLARENFKTNPAVSQYLFARLMRYPLGFHWYLVLYDLGKENRSVTDTLYQQLLQNYQNESPRRLLYLAAYPFASSRTFGVDKYQWGMSVPQGFAPNPALQKQFFQTYFRRVGTFTANADNLNQPSENYQLPESASMVSALQDMEPIVMENFPGLIQSLALAKSQANGVLSEEVARKLEASQNINQNVQMSFEEKFKALEKADVEGKLTDQQIINLIFNADQEDEFKKLESWIDKIREESPRLETTNYFYFKRAETAKKDKRFDDAKRFAQKVPEIEFRAFLFFELAGEQLKNVNESALVMETLGEVSRMARSAEDSSGKAQVLLGLAYRYEKTHHTLALGELGEAIRVINSLENPDIFTDFIYRHIFGQGYGFAAGFTTTGYNLETTFEEISKKDFELSLANARNLNDKYFRTLAVLAVAKNCVQNQPKTKPKK